MLPIGPTYAIHMSDMQLSCTIEASGLQHAPAHPPTNSVEPPLINVANHQLPAELLHDLRTPLNHIIGYSELLIEQTTAAGHSEYLPYLQKVLAAGHHLLGLMNTNLEPISAPEAPRSDDGRNS
jgi:signal transduction histidine kinase